MVKVHEECNVPGEVSGVTQKGSMRRKIRLSISDLWGKKATRVKRIRQAQVRERGPGPCPTS